MRRRKRRKDKDAKRPPSPVEVLGAMWQDIMKRHNEHPKFAGKYASAKGSPPPRKAVPVPTAAPPTPAPARYVVQHPRQPGKATAARLAFIAQYGQEAWDERERAAREVPHTVMAGHKQGYELVTDPEMIKQMGKKTA